jgi:antitoxin component HigA of HigAB toxin-antitoxin module
MLPFYFIFNEWHSQTTSEKIRAVFQKQAEQGKYRANRPPYGYEKHPEDKYKLIIDPVTAPTVKRIFEMRLEKKSFGSIAKTLNNEGVICPNAYSAEKYERVEKKPKANKWSTGSVILIINNPTYCGDVVQNRVGCASYKNQKQMKKSPDEWVTVPNMHPPLVTREDFQKCQDMREDVGRVRSTQYAEITPFTGLIKCPDCGYTLTRTSTYYTIKGTGEKKLLIAYNCGAYANMGKTACSSHYILEKDLKELVMADIREKASEVLIDENAARERYYAIKAQSNGSQLQTDRNALQRVNKRLAELDKLLQAAFEKTVLGGESAELFAGLERKYQAEKQELTAQVRVLSASIDKHSKTERDVDTFIGLMKKHADITDLDRATAVELIDHITVSASATTPREIVIYYNLIGSGTRVASLAATARQLPVCG